MSHDHGQYGLPDIRQLMTGRPPPQFGGLPIMSGQTQVVESFPVLHHPGLLPLTTPHHYESLGSSGGGVLCTAPTVRGGGGSSSTVDFDLGRQESTVMMNPSTAARGVACGLELEGGFGIGGEAAGNGRWPRQETLTLLEIRSRLDFKFKEANQKGPLWDEVSRIMGEENGYHRSGKKCREKFENLYKYYKKTKEGKAGRQDGKHYRFFRQLEAIYGGSNNNNLNQPPSSLQETNLPSYNNNMPLLGHDMIKNQETGHHHHHHHFQEHSKNMISESLSFTNEYSSTELETSSSENINANNEDNQDLSAIAFMMSGQNNKSKEKRIVGRSGNWKAKVKEFIDSNMRKLMETQEEWMERMLKAIEVKETERMREEEERRRQEAARLEREQEFWAKERAWLEARDVALMEALKKVSGDSPNSDNNNLGVFCNIMEERSKKLKEDTRTYNYFQQLDLYNNNSQDHHHQQQHQEEGNGGINMDSNSNVGILHMNNDQEMWWDKFGLKLSNDKYHQG